MYEVKLLLQRLLNSDSHGNGHADQGLLPARQKSSEAPLGLPKVEKFHKKQDLSITIREPFNLSVLTHPQLFVDESKTKGAVPQNHRDGD